MTAQLPTTRVEPVADLSPAEIALEAAIQRAEAALNRLEVERAARARLWAWPEPKIEQLH